MRIFFVSEGGASKVGLERAKETAADATSATVEASVEVALDNLPVLALR